MIHEKITYSPFILRTLLKAEDTCVYCIENRQRSFRISPFQLDDLKGALKQYLRSKVQSYDPELKGIILGHRKIQIINSVQLNDDGAYRLDYILDIYIFKPSFGNLLKGRVNKKCQDGLGVLVHSVINATIPRPHYEIGNLKPWLGSKVKIGEHVTFEVISFNLLSKPPVVQGKLVRIEEKIEDGDSGIGGHESTEEGANHGSSVPKSGHTDVNENIHLERKKRKRRYAIGGLDEPLLDLDTSISMNKMDTSSTLSQQTAILNEVISSPKTSNIVEIKGILKYQSSPSLSTSELDNMKVKVEKSASKKRKRDSSFAELANSLTKDETERHSLHSFSSSDVLPKSKKRKTSFQKDLVDKSGKGVLPEFIDDLNSTTNVVIDSLIASKRDSLKPKKSKDLPGETKTMEAPLSQGSPDSLGLSQHFNEVDYYSSLGGKIKKHKKKKKSTSEENTEVLSVSEGDSILPGTSQQLLENDSDKNNELISHKKHKKKKSHSFHNIEESSVTNNELEFVKHLDSSDNQLDISQIKRKTKKKKKSKHLNLEADEQDSMPPITPEMAPPMPGKVKKNKSASDENPDIQQIGVSSMSAEIGTFSEVKEKKKKKKSKHLDLEAPEQDSEPPITSEMAPPMYLKVKKKKICY